MGKITLDDGRSFTVDDSFGKLPPDQQQQIVDELKQQLRARGVADDISRAARSPRQAAMRARKTGGPLSFGDDRLAFEKE